MIALALLAALIVADAVLCVATFRRRPSLRVSVLAIVCGAASIALSAFVLLGGGTG